MTILIGKNEWILLNKFLIWIRKVFENFLNACFRVLNTHNICLFSTISTEFAVDFGCCCCVLLIKNTISVTNLNLTLISPHFLCALCADKCVFYGSLDLFDEFSCVKYQILDTKSKGKLKTKESNAYSFISNHFLRVCVPLYLGMCLCISFHCRGFIIKIWSGRA